jgi:hypothetical protein
VILRELTGCTPAFLLLAIMQLIGALYGAAPGVLTAICVGTAAAVAPRFLSIGLERWWLLTVLAATASLAGVALPMFAERTQWGMLLLPLIAGSVACIIAVARSGGAPQCASCKRGLKDISFECPRCGQVVCERSCWNYQSSRCRACELNQVPILSSDSSWWERNLGRRIPKGKCQICLTSATSADLRACQQCARPYCRGCWDASNGQCVHCFWTVRELPARLQRYVLRVDSPTRSTRRVRPRAG